VGHIQSRHDGDTIHPYDFATGTDAFHLLAQVPGSPKQGLLFTLWTRDLKLFLHDRNGQGFAASIAHESVPLTVFQGA
jgi:hypothetical protein